MAKTLPKHFTFSQGSLQAYVDCPRLFQLRYIERMAWPALDVEPNIEAERHMALGSAFHQLVQRFYLGLPVEKLAELALQDPMLTQWWENFLEYGPELDGYTKHLERTLSIPIGGFRLVAKYDLLAITSPALHPSSSPSARIFDWKTSRHLPKRQWLKGKLQTRVYPFVLAQASCHLNNGEAIDPDQIEMTYWFANHPTAPLRFPYSSARYRSDAEYLAGLIAEIQSLPDGEAPMTEDERLCRFCVYRSLCARGVSAGLYSELEEDTAECKDFDFALDFEQVAEIEF